MSKGTSAKEKQQYPCTTLSCLSHRHQKPDLLEPVEEFFLFEHPRKEEWYAKKFAGVMDKEGKRWERDRDWHTLGIIDLFVSMHEIPPVRK